VPRGAASLFFDIFDVEREEDFSTENEIFDQDDVNRPTGKAGGIGEGI
jgi:hypothetical protein